MLVEVGFLVLLLAAGGEATVLQDFSGKVEVIDSALRICIVEQDGCAKALRFT
jgi:hypothetical protein